MTSVSNVTGQPVTSSNGAAATSSDPATASAQNTANFNSFLKLLTTQLSNQDPLNPIDATQFTSQLAQFSQVEQQVQTNSNLKGLLTAQNATQSMSSISLLGKMVEVQGKAATLQNGSAEWDYTLSGNASATAITVTDSQGNVVRSTTGAVTSGAHQFVWDGKADDGTQLPNGQYTVQVTALDSNQASVPVTVDSVTSVTGVSFSSGVAHIETANGEIALSDLVSVREPSATQTAANP